VRKAEKQFDPATEDIQDALRMIVATSAVSHGVDVENFNAMFFAGMPTAIDEFIQASSRVGRTHVGFSMLFRRRRTDGTASSSRSTKRSTVSWSA